MQFHFVKTSKVEIDPTHRSETYIPVISVSPFAPLPGRREFEGIYANFVAMKNAFFRSSLSTICISTSSPAGGLPNPNPRGDLSHNLPDECSGELCKKNVSGKGAA
jgi:hypothetical protein